MLFTIMMDYLPIQGMSIPCECMFSSVKEMDTNKWNRMSPLLMEALQLLKFSIKKQHLNFMDGWSMLGTAMGGVPQPTHSLNSLFVGNPNVVMDSILNAIDNYYWWIATIAMNRKSWFILQASVIASLVLT